MVVAIAMTTTGPPTPPADRRGYHQFCGVAKALDVVGERWTLLVVRELLLGPKRFTDVLAALPGLSTNLLAARLQSLQAGGLVQRRRLPAPAASTVYELTEAGRGLGEVVKHLGRWGMRYLDHPEPEDAFRPGWVALYFELYADRERARGVHDLYDFEVDGQAFHVRVDDGAIEVREGPAPLPADVRIRADLDTFVQVGLGRMPAAEAARTGRFVVEGEPAALLRCTEILGASPAEEPAATRV